ncbi:MAG: carbohydrate-binding family 9-like protein [Aurantibacter sp.]
MIQSTIWVLSCLLTINSFLVDYSPAIKVADEVTIKSIDDFEIDGAGAAEAWSLTKWIHLPPLKGVNEAYETKVKILYSSTGIYFLFWCEDDKITATLQNDFADLYNEDVVEVFLWTNEAHPVYFEYELSPLNYELPIMVPNLDSTFMGWKPWHYEGDRLTRHATQVQGGEKVSGAVINSWTAEFFIPYKLLKPLTNVPPSKGTRWRANMYRLDYDQSASVGFAWQPVRTNFHDYQSYGTFIFD